MLFRLLDEDSKEIRSLMRKLDKKQVDLAPILGFSSQGRLSPALNGHAKLSQDQLSKIYYFLCRDNSVRYLLDYENRKLRISLFEERSSELKKSYLSLPAIKRNKVLASLERLTKEYS